MTIQLSISGMTCGHCARAVRAALAAVDGVVDVVDVSVERGEATVEGTADVAALIAAVAAEGYGAEPRS